MGDNRIRELVKKAFPYKKWWRKVDAMSEAQVIAVYFRLHKQGKI